MEFKVSKKKKGIVVRDYIDHTWKLSWMLKISRFWLPVLAGVVIVVAVMLLLIPSWGVSYASGAAEKQTAIILAGAGDVLGIFLVVYALMRRQIRKEISRSLLERSDERLEIRDGEILYYFHQAYGNDQDAKRFGGAVGADVVVTLPFSKIEELLFDQDTKKLTFIGEFPCQYFEDFGYKGSHIGTAWKTEFVIFDYFTPSLTDEIVRRFQRTKDVHMSSRFVSGS